MNGTDPKYNNNDMIVKLDATNCINPKKWEWHQFQVLSSHSTQSSHLSSTNSADSWFRKEMYQRVIMIRRWQGYEFGKIWLHILRFYTIELVCMALSLTSHFTFGFLQKYILKKISILENLVGQYNYTRTFNSVV